MPHLAVTALLMNRFDIFVLPANEINLPRIAHGHEPTRIPLFSAVTRSFSLGATDKLT